MSKDTILASAINLSQIAQHPAEAIAALARIVLQQGAQIQALQERRDRDYERFSGDIADHGQRIKRLEIPQKECRPGQKQNTRLNRLEALLIARGNEPVTFSEVGKYLELGTRNGKTNTRRQNMTHLGKIIANDGRFRVFDSNTQKGSKMISLEETYFLQGPKV